ncbi:MAG: hypothetical protein ACTSRD_09850, partial [Promethearchaeota archaeon]
ADIWFITTVYSENNKIDGFPYSIIIAIIVIFVIIRVRFSRFYKKYLIRHENVMMEELEMR